MRDQGTSHLPWAVDKQIKRFVDLSCWACPCLSIPCSSLRSAADPPPPSDLHLPAASSPLRRPWNQPRSASRKLSR